MRAQPAAECRPAAASSTPHPSASVTDTATPFPPEPAQARAEREQESLEEFRGKLSRMRSLADFHRMLFTTVRTVASPAPSLGSLPLPALGCCLPILLMKRLAGAARGASVFVRRRWCDWRPLRQACALCVASSARLRAAQVLRSLETARGWSGSVGDE